MRNLKFFLLPFLLSSFAYSGEPWSESLECQALDEYLGIGRDSDNIQDTDAFLVLKHEKLVYEKYAPGYTIDTPHRMWSASKLVANLIVGRAIKERRLQLDQRLDDFFPASSYQHAGKAIQAYKKIKIKDLLEMQSGFEWQELETYDLEKLDVVKMIYGAQSQNVLSYVLSRPVLEERVGKVFNYSTGDYNILSGVLRKVYGANYEKLPWKLLFNEMGMKGVVVERDSQGTYLLGSNIYMSPKDFSKIGVLLLENGLWQGNKLLPSGWVENMRAINRGLFHTSFDAKRIQSLGVLGTPFWLNLSMPKVPSSWPDFPKDTYMSFGFMGQNLAVIPSQNLIYLRFGQDPRYGRKVNGIAKKLYGCLGSGKIL